MNVTQIIGVSLALAFLAESMTEYLFGTLADHLPALAPLRWALQYIAALAGVGLAFFYRLDLIGVIGGLDASWVGFILSGLVIGRGANFLHQFVSQYFPKVLTA